MQEGALLLSHNLWTMSSTDLLLCNIEEQRLEDLTGLSCPLELAEKQDEAKEQIDQTPARLLCVVQE
jgi:hypothetical protein